MQSSIIFFVGVFVFSTISFAQTAWDPISSSNQCPQNKFFNHTYTRKVNFYYEKDANGACHAVPEALEYLKCTSARIDAVHATASEFAIGGTQACHTETWNMCAGETFSPAEECSYMGLGSFQSELPEVGEYDRNNCKIILESADGPSDTCLYRAEYRVELEGYARCFGGCF